MSFDFKTFVIFAAAYIAFASPKTFDFTHKNVGKPLGASYVDAAGRPTNAGLLVHALLFALVTPRVLKAL